MISNGSAIQRENKSIGEYDSEELIWKFTRRYPFTDANDYINYLHELANFENRRLFCIFDAVYNYQIGLTGYIDNSPEGLNIEIGIVWISPVAQRTNAGLEMCFLMANHAFEIGYRRVQWGSFKENFRSNKLAEKAGFNFEFIIKNYHISKNRGYNLVYYRILDFEWPEIKKILYNKLDY